MEKTLKQHEIKGDKKKMSREELVSYLHEINQSDNLYRFLQLSLCAADGFTKEELEQIIQLPDTGFDYLRVAKKLDDILYQQILKTPEYGEEFFLDYIYQRRLQQMEKTNKKHRWLSKKQKNQVEQLLRLIQPLDDAQVNEVIQAYENGIPIQMLEKIVQPNRSAGQMKLIFKLLDKN